MVVYADETTMYVALPAQQKRRRFANGGVGMSQRLNLGVIGVVLKLNQSASLRIVITRSRTAFPLHHHIDVNGVSIPRCFSLNLLSDAWR